MPTTSLPTQRRGLSLPRRSDPVVRSVAAAWRVLTSPRSSARRGAGAATLIACSGGGDSSALALALTVASRGTGPRGTAGSKRLALAHVVHDLRPACQALADRDSVRKLASLLELDFLEASVAVVAMAGNAEANARRARYDALRRLAVEHGYRYVATAHNAQDQAESVLMALLRGAGVNGLAGIAPSRPLRSAGAVERVTLIRPMLDVSPQQARELCSAAGWTWAHDATNDDLSRVRNAVRAGVIPALLKVNPRAVDHIARASRACAGASVVVQRIASRLLIEAERSTKSGSVIGLHWNRARLQAVPESVMGEAIRKGVSRIAGQDALDKLPARCIASAVRVVMSANTDPKVIVLAGVELRVTAARVILALDASDSP